MVSNDLNQRATFLMECIYTRHIKPLRYFDERFMRHVEHQIPLRRVCAEQITVLEGIHRRVTR